MTFTDEPSILVDGRFGVRIEDVVVCEAGGGRKLNRFPPDLIVNALTGRSNESTAPFRSKLLTSPRDAQVARRPGRAH